MPDAVYRRVGACLVALLHLLGTAATGQPRARIRELGIEPGVLAPGPLNAITDVGGVRVGHRTLARGEAVRTGVTAILPHAGNPFQEKVPAAVYVGNGFGKAAGFLQVEELGRLETPIVLTNTLSVGTAIQAVVAWTLERRGNEEVRSVNAVIGETNDGYLNDIRGLHVTPADVRAAIDGAAAGPVAEGSVGAGTGTRALGWKGGIGTSSRRLPASLGGWTVGALVQSNFGGVLRIDGVPVGEHTERYPFRDALWPPAADAEAPLPEGPRRTPADHPAPGDPSELGSCMIVLATDAPLGARNLERLARRAVLALGRVGSFMSNGSGDFVVAFSTAHRIPSEPPERSYTAERLRNDAMSPLFLATVEATEEAIYNSLLKATTVTGYRGRRVEAIPLAELCGILGAYGRLAPGEESCRAAAVR